jgi:nitrate/nitrite-specific signal transduction histidine kinase
MDAVGYGRRVSLRQLKWLTIVGPLVFLAVIVAARRLVQSELFSSLLGDLLLFGFLLAAVLLFSGTVFGRIERMQASLERQNRELLALHEAGLDVAGELGLETVLQKVVDHATGLIGARYGALALPAADGGVEALFTSGLTSEQRATIGPLPNCRGLLGVVLRERMPLRLADVTRDRRAVGFPPGHPPMRSLLAVPVVTGERVLGALYVAEKVGAAEFSAEDEDTLVRFATQAALAIDNARLHRRVRDVAITEERERIAREMHDSLAQVLGYVITKAQAVQELLKRGETDRASAQVSQLSTAARAAYADVREGILALRMSVGSERGLLDALTEYLDRWKEQSDVEAALIVRPEGERLERLSPVAELQLLRIVQEALSNVRKHADATRAEVCITAHEGAIETVVADNGRGFDPGSPSRDGHERIPQFGLATMRERAESVGGTLRIDSTPGSGTRVVVQLPT